MVLMNAFIRTTLRLGFRFTGKLEKNKQVQMKGANRLFLYLITPVCSHITFVFAKEILEQSFMVNLNSFHVTGNWLKIEQQLEVYSSQIDNNKTNSTSLLLGTPQ